MHHGRTIVRLETHATMLPVTRTQTGSLRLAKQTSDAPSPSPPHKAESRKQYRQTNPEDAISSQNCESIRASSEISDSNEPLGIPRFTIHLSLPPEQRYLEVCAALQDEMRGLQNLFDGVVGSFLPWVPSVVLRWVCWALLWRVYSDEESAELKVSTAALSDMYHSD